LGINPSVCMGVIYKFWENVQDALDRIIEAVKECWCKNPSGFS